MTVAPPTRFPLAYDGHPHPVVDGLLHVLGAPAGLDRAIHADDEMLAFDRRRLGDPDLGLGEYFWNGHRVAATIGRLAAWRFGGLDRVGRVLDFASGFGRITRFLVGQVPTGSVTVAEINPEAMAFQAARFGVRALVSTTDPDAFEPGERYDLVVVTSLFTHLPRATFGPWLRRLRALLAPGGMLVASTHDVEHAREHGEPEGGFFFLPISESGFLDGETYGSTFVSEAFVRAELAGDDGVAVWHLPSALCGFQDLLVVVADPSLRGTALPLEHDAHGAIDLCRREDGRLHLVGWALCPQPVARLAAVDLHVGEELVARTTELGWRDDVAARYAGPAAGDAGFTLTWDLPCDGVPLATPLVLRAMSASGQATTLWAGTLGHALLHGARLDLEAGRIARERLAFRNAQLGHEVAALEARLAAMEASRFWRLRNRWFALKRALGFTDEP